MSSHNLWVYVNPLDQNRCVAYRFTCLLCRYCSVLQSAHYCMTWGSFTCNKEHTECQEFAWFPPCLFTIFPSTTIFVALHRLSLVFVSSSCSHLLELPIFWSCPAYAERQLIGNGSHSWMGASRVSVYGGPLLVESGVGDGIFWRCLPSRNSAITI